jgi:hypothetical protein
MPARHKRAKGFETTLPDTHMRGCKSLYRRRSKEILVTCKHQLWCLQISNGCDMKKILKTLAVPTAAFVLAAAIPAHAAEPVRTDANANLQTSTSVANKDANAGTETAEPLTYKVVLAGLSAVAFVALRRRQS